MTIVVAEKDRTSQVLSFVISLNMAAYRGLNLPGNPITAAVIRKAIKLTHCISFSFANEHNFKQNFAMVNQKFPP